MPDFLYALLIACSVSALSLSAEPAVIITPNNLRDRIRAENPDLAAARLRIQEAIGRSVQAGRLSNPQLQAGFEHNARFREGRVEIGLSQRFPVTDRLRLETAISLTLLEAAEAEVREAERQLATTAREIVVRILATRQRRELLGEQAALAGELAGFLADTAAKGEGSVLDAGQARLEATSLATALRQLDAEETALLGKLKPLLGMRPGQPLSVAGALKAPVLPREAADPAERPDFQQARLDAKAAAESTSLERARRFEDVQGGLFVAGERIEDQPLGYRDEAIIGLRFQMELPFWNHNEGAIHEAEARHQRKEMEVSALGRKILLEADAARAEMAQWKQLLAEIDTTLLPLAREQAQLAETAYRNGQGDIQSVLRAREKRLQLSAARLDALREFHLALVRHDAALGQ